MVQTDSGSNSGLCVCVRARACGDAQGVILLKLSWRGKNGTIHWDSWRVEFQRLNPVVKDANSNSCHWAIQPCFFIWLPLKHKMSTTEKASKGKAFKQSIQNTESDISKCSWSFHFLFPWQDSMKNTADYHPSLSPILVSYYFLCTVGLYFFQSPLPWMNLLMTTPASLRVSVSEVRGRPKEAKP